MSHLPVPQGSLTSYLVEINRFPLLSPEEELDLAFRLREKNDIEAAHRLVTSNLRFVVKIAHEYASYGFRMADLIQEGNVGLMHAVKRFDPHKGFRLISYAVWWIRAYIQNFILRSWSLVKIGTTQAQRKLFYKLRQAKRALAARIPGLEHLNNEACEALARKFKVREDEIIEMEARLKARDASLDQPITAESGTTHLDLLVAQDNPEELVARREQQARIQEKMGGALGALNERERFIVLNRLMSDQPITLQEIGNRFRITRERARQVEEQVKKKLRTALAALAA